MKKTKSVKKITKLTPEQEAAIPGWRDRWIRIGLSTEPADRPRFEKAVAECYRFAGLEPPKRVVWVPSPMVLALAAPIAAIACELLKWKPVGDAVYVAVDVAVRGAVNGAVDDAVHDAVHDAVGGAVYGAVDGAVDGAVHGAVDGAVYGAVHGAVDGAVHGAVHGAVYGAVGGAVDGAVDGAVHGAVYGAVGGAVDGAVYGAVDGAVYGAVGDAVHDAVGGAVDGAVYGAVHDAVGGAVDGAVYDAVYGAVYGASRKSSPTRKQSEASRKIVEAIPNLWHRRFGGSLWPAWHAWRSFFTEVCGLDLKGDLNARSLAYGETIQSACWWWPHRDWVMVCERPTVIRRDDRGRLHCENGPAIAWPDGWGVFSWHGTRVPSEWITNPGSLDPATALTWQNVEQRRCAAEILGWAKVLGSLKPRVIDKDPDPMIGELLEVDLPDSPGERFLRVLCGTQREFCLPVPKESKTALEAQSMTSQIPIEVLKGGKWART